MNKLKESAILPGMKEQLGNVLKEIRKSLDLTLEEAAKKTGVNFASISRYESGKHLAGIDVLKKLAAGYGTTVREILRKVGMD